MQRQSDVQISNSIWVIDYWNNAHAPKAWHFQSHLHFISQAVMIFLPLLVESDLMAGGFGDGLLLGSMDWLCISPECSLDTWNRCASFASSLLYKCHQLYAIFSQVNVEHMVRNLLRSALQMTFVWLGSPTSCASESFNVCSFSKKHICSMGVSTELSLYLKW